MIGVTLDTNCIIDLEEKRPNAQAISDIVHLNDQQMIEVRLVAASGYEKQRGETCYTNFDGFLEKIRPLGLSDLIILAPLFYVGVSALGYSMVADEPMVLFEQKIHDILFPSMPFDYNEFCTLMKVDPNHSHFPNSTTDAKWINAKCDVQAMWCHIYYNGNVFVTNDTNFHKETKKARLLEIGAGAIVRPYEAVQLLKEHHTAFDTLSG